MKKKWEKIETTSSWDFKEEKELIGVYKGIETEVGPNKSNLYTFQKEDGDLIAVWGNAVLDMRFKNLVIGQNVKIVYRGKVKSEKTGREYNDFDVFKEKVEGVEKGVEIEDEPRMNADEIPDEVF